jgi:hypothetical protein
MQITCSDPDGPPLVLYEGQLMPRKIPRGILDRYLDDLETSSGLPLIVEAIYDVSSDNGRLEVSTAGRPLIQVAPFCRSFQMIITLPTGEELCITSLPVK